MVDLNNPAIAALLLEVLQTDDLAAIVDKASDVLGNPIALLDSTYRILASSSSLVPDEAWNKAMQRRAWSYELVAKVNRLLNIDEGGSLQKPIILDDLGSHRRRVAALRASGVFLGYYVTLEVTGTLEEVDEGLHDLVGKVLAKALATNRAVSLQANPGSISVFLQDLLAGRFTDRMLFKERLKGCRLSLETEFQTIAISLASYLPGNLHENRLRNALKNIFASSWSVPEGPYVIVLLDIGAISRQKNDPFADFIAFLQENHITAGQSQPFTDLFLLPEHRDRAVRTLKLASQFQGSPLFPKKKELASYEDYTLLDLLSRQPQGSIHYYCNRKVYSIYLHDIEHNTEYISTLFHYISTGKSMHKASERLFVHHNTVYYRINKMKEIFGMDFDNQESIMQYYFSCIVLLLFM